MYCFSVIHFFSYPLMQVNWVEQENWLIYCIQLQSIITELYRYDHVIIPSIRINDQYTLDEWILLLDIYDDLRRYKEVLVQIIDL